MTVITLQHKHLGAVKLGCNHKLNLKALPLSNYVNPKAMSYPPTCSWWRPIKFGMLGNDTVGDCVIAYMLHQIKIWWSIAHAGEPLPDFTDEQAIQLYSAITGYNPADPSTDQGTDPDTALAYWQQNGLFGHTIAGYVNIDVTNIDMLRYAISIFGGIGFSFNVPAYIMNIPGGASWSYKPGNDITNQGGHQVGAIGYGRHGFREDCWDTTNTFDPEFIGAFGVAAQAVVSPEWLEASGVTITGLHLQDLLADLAETPSPASALHVQKG